MELTKSLKYDEGFNENTFNKNEEYYSRRYNNDEEIMNVQSRYSTKRRSSCDDYRNSPEAISERIRDFRYEYNNSTVHRRKHSEAVNENTSSIHLERDHVLLEGNITPTLNEKRMFIHSVDIKQEPLSPRSIHYENSAENLNNGGSLENGYRRLKQPYFFSSYGVNKQVERVSHSVSPNSFNYSSSYANELKYNKARKRDKWNPKQSEICVNMWKALYKDLHTPEQDDAWMKIKTAVDKGGLVKTVKQIKIKIKNMKREYRVCSDHNKMNRTKPQYCPFYDVLDSVLGGFDENYYERLSMDNPKPVILEPIERSTPERQNIRETDLIIPTESIEDEMEIETPYRIYPVNEHKENVATHLQASDEDHRERAYVRTPPHPPLYSVVHVPGGKGEYPAYEFYNGSTLDNMPFNRESRGSKRDRWSYNQSAVCVSTWRSLFDEIQSTENAAAWLKVKDAVDRAGPEKTLKQIKIKIKNLKFEYRLSRDNARNKKRPSYCQFYKDFNAVLGDDAFVDDSSRDDDGERHDTLNGVDDTEGHTNHHEFDHPVRIKEEPLDENGGTPFEQSKHNLYQHPEHPHLEKESQAKNRLSSKGDADKSKVISNNTGVRATRDRWNAEQNEICVSTWKALYHDLNDEAWLKIQSAVNATGLPKSLKQIKTKIKNLKCEYRICRDNNIMNLDKKHYCQFYDEIDSVLGDTPGRSMVLNDRHEVKSIPSYAPEQPLIIDTRPNGHTETFNSSEKESRDSPYANNSPISNEPLVSVIPSTDHAVYASSYQSPHISPIPQIYTSYSSPYGSPLPTKEELLKPITSSNEFQRLINIKRNKWGFRQSEICINTWKKNYVKLQSADEHEAWMRIKEAVDEVGPSKTLKQIKTKIRNMKRDYRTCRKNKEVNKNFTQICQFYDEIHSVLRNDGYFSDTDIDEKEHATTDIERSQKTPIANGDTSAFSANDDTHSFKNKQDVSDLNTTEYFTTDLGRQKLCVVGPNTISIGSMDDEPPEIYTSGIIDANDIDGISGEENSAKQAMLRELIEIQKENIIAQRQAEVRHKRFMFLVKQLKEVEKEEREKSRHLFSKISQDLEL